MNNAIAEIYQKIADKIVALIDGDWSDAVVNVEFGSGVCHLQGVYQTDRGEARSHGFATDFELAQLFQQLLEEMVEAGEEPWKEASFSLDRDGKFHLAFSR